MFNIITRIFSFVSLEHGSSFVSGKWVWLQYILSLVGNWFTKLIDGIQSLIWILIKFLLSVVDALEYLINKFLGVGVGLDDLDSYLTERDLYGSFVNIFVRAFRALMAVGLLFIIIFTIVSIVKQEFSYASSGFTKTDKKGNVQVGNDKSRFVKNIFIKIMAMFLIPSIMILSVVAVNSLLESFQNAIRGDNNASLAGQLLSASTYDVNKYRSYANNNKRIPITITAYDADSYGPDQASDLNSEIRKVSTQYKLKKASIDIQSKGSLTFNDTLTYKNNKFVNSAKYADYYETFICTQEQYQVMADFIDYIELMGKEFYIKSIADETVDWQYVHSAVFDGETLRIQYSDMNDLDGDGITYDTSSREFYEIEYAPAVEITTPISDASNTIMALLGLDKYTDDTFKTMYRDQTGDYTNLVQWSNEKVQIKLSSGFSLNNPGSWTIGDQIIMYELNHFSSNNTFFDYGIDPTNQEKNIEILKEGIELDAREIVYRDYYPIADSYSKEKTMPCVLINGSYYRVSNEYGATDSYGNKLYNLLNANETPSYDTTGFPAFLENTMIAIQVNGTHTLKLNNSPNLSDLRTNSAKNQMILYEYYKDDSPSNTLYNYTLTDLVQGITLPQYKIDSDNYVYINGTYYNVSSTTNGVQLVEFSENSSTNSFYKYTISLPNEDATKYGLANIDSSFEHVDGHGDVLKEININQDTTGANATSVVMHMDDFEALNPVGENSPHGNLDLNFKLSSNFNYSDPETWTYRDFFLYYLYSCIPNQIVGGIETLKSSGLKTSVKYYSIPGYAGGWMRINGSYYYINVDYVLKISEELIVETLDVDETIFQNYVDSTDRNLFVDIQDTSSLRNVQTTTKTFYFSDDFRKTSISTWTVQDMILYLLGELGIIRSVDELLVTGYTSAVYNVNADNSGTVIDKVYKFGNLVDETDTSKASAVFLSENAIKNIDLDYQTIDDFLNDSASNFLVKMYNTVDSKKTIGNFIADSDGVINNFYDDIKGNILTTSDMLDKMVEEGALSYKTGIGAYTISNHNGFYVDNPSTWSTLDLCMFLATGETQKTYTGEVIKYNERSIFDASYDSDEDKYYLVVGKNAFLIDKEEYSLSGASFSRITSTLKTIFTDTATKYKYLSSITNISTLDSIIHDITGSNVSATYRIYSFRGNANNRYIKVRDKLININYDGTSAYNISYNTGALINTIENVTANSSISVDYANLNSSIFKFMYDYTTETKTEMESKHKEALEIVYADYYKKYVKQTVDSIASEENFDYTLQNDFDINYFSNAETGFFNANFTGFDFILYYNNVIGTKRTTDEQVFGKKVTTLDGDIYLKFEGTDAASIKSTIYIKYDTKLIPTSTNKSTLKREFALNYYYTRMFKLNFYSEFKEGVFNASASLAIQSPGARNSYSNLAQSYENDLYTVDLARFGEYSTTSLYKFDLLYYYFNEQERNASSDNSFLTFIDSSNSNHSYLRLQIGNRFYYISSDYISTDANKDIDVVRTSDITLETADGYDYLGVVIYKNLGLKKGNLYTFEYHDDVNDKDYTIYQFRNEFDEMLYSLKQETGVTSQFNSAISSNEISYTTPEALSEWSMFDYFVNYARGSLYSGYESSKIYKYGSDMYFKIDKNNYLNIAEIQVGGAGDMVANFANNTEATFVSNNAPNLFSKAKFEIASETDYSDISAAGFTSNWTAGHTKILSYTKYKNDWVNFSSSVAHSKTQGVYSVITEVYDPTTGTTMANNQLNLSISSGFKGGDYSTWKLSDFVIYYLYKKDCYGDSSTTNFQTFVNKGYVNAWLNDWVTEESDGSVTSIKILVCTEDLVDTADAYNTLCIDYLQFKYLATRKLGPTVTVSTTTPEEGATVSRSVGLEIKSAITVNSCTYADTYYETIFNRTYINYSATKDLVYESYKYYVYDDTKLDILGIFNVSPSVVLKIKNGEGVPTGDEAVPTINLKLSSTDIDEWTILDFIIVYEYSRATKNNIFSSYKSISELTTRSQYTTVYTIDGKHYIKINGNYYNLDPDQYITLKDFSDSDGSSTIKYIDGTTVKLSDIGFEYKIKNGITLIQDDEHNQYIEVYKYYEDSGTYFVKDNNWSLLTQKDVVYDISTYEYHKEYTITNSVITLTANINVGRDNAVSSATVSIILANDDTFMFEGQKYRLETITIDSDNITEFKIYSSNNTDVTDSFRDSALKGVIDSITAKKITLTGTDAGNYIIDKDGCFTVSSGATYKYLPNSTTNIEYLVNTKIVDDISDLSKASKGSFYNRYYEILSNFGILTTEGSEKEVFNIVRNGTFSSYSFKALEAIKEYTVTKIGSIELKPASEALSFKIGNTIYNIEIHKGNNVAYKVDFTDMHKYSISPIVREVNWPQKLMNDMRVIYPDINWGTLVATSGWIDTLGYFDSSVASGQFITDGNSANITATGLVLSEFLVSLASESDKGYAYFEYDSVYDDDIIKALMLSMLGEYEYNNLKWQAEIFVEMFNTCFATILDDIAAERDINILDGRVDNFTMSVYKAYLSTVLLSSDFGEYLYTIANRVFAQYTIYEALATAGGDYAKYYAYINGGIDETGDLVKSFTYGSFYDLVMYENDVIGNGVATFTFNIAKAYRYLNPDQSGLSNSDILTSYVNSKTSFYNLFKQIDSEYEKQYKQGNEIAEDSPIYCFMLQVYYDIKYNMSSLVTPRYLTIYRDYLDGKIERWSIIDGVNVEEGAKYVKNYGVYATKREASKLLVIARAALVNVSAGFEILNQCLDESPLYREYYDYLKDNLTTALMTDEGIEDVILKSEGGSTTAWNKISKIYEYLGLCLDKYSQIVAMEYGEVDEYGCEKISRYTITVNEETLEIPLTDELYQLGYADLSTFYSAIEAYVNAQNMLDKVTKTCITYTLQQYSQNYVPDGYSFTIENRNYTLDVATSSAERIAEYALGGAFLDSVGVSPHYTDTEYEGFLEYYNVYDSEDKVMKKQLNVWSQLREFASSLADYTSSLYYTTNLNNISKNNYYGKELVKSYYKDIANVVVDGQRVLEAVTANGLWTATDANWLLFKETIDYLLNSEETDLPENQDDKIVIDYENVTFEEFRVYLIKGLINYESNASETAEQNTNRFLSLFNLVCIGESIETNGTTQIKAPTIKKDENNDGIYEYYVKNSDGSESLYSPKYSFDKQTRNIIIRLAGLENRPLEELVNAQYDKLYDRAGSYDESLGDTFVVCMYDESTGKYIPYLTANPNIKEIDFKDYDKYMGTGGYYDTYGKRFFTKYYPYKASGSTDAYHYPIVAKGVITSSGEPTAIKTDQDGNVLFYRTNISGTWQLDENAAAATQMVMESKTIGFTNYVDTVAFSGAKGSSGRALFIGSYNFAKYFSSDSSAYYVQLNMQYNLDEADAFGGYSVLDLFSSFYTLGGNIYMLLSMALTLMLPMLVKASATVFRRVLDLLTLILMSPIAVSCSALDPEGDGKSFGNEIFKKWFSNVVNTYIIAFGYIIGFNIFYIIISVVNQTTFVSEETLTKIHQIGGMDFITFESLNAIVKYAFIIAGVGTVKASANLLMTIVSGGRVKDAFETEFSKGTWDSIVKIVKDIQAKANLIKGIYTGQALIQAKDFAVERLKNSIPGAKLAEGAIGLGKRAKNRATAKRFEKAAIENGASKTAAKKSAKMFRENENRARLIQKQNRANSANAFAASMGLDELKVEVPKGPKGKSGGKNKVKEQKGAKGKGKGKGKDKDKDSKSRENDQTQEESKNKKKSKKNKKKKK